MRPIRVPVLLWIAAPLLVFACSSASGDGSSFPGQGGNGTGGTAGTIGLGGTGGGLDIDGAAGGGPPPCPQETQYVYVVTGDNVFYKFDPPTLMFNEIGKLSCPNTGGNTPFSMSVDRKGVAWVVFNGGKIYWVDVKTAKCTATSYVASQSGFTTFGMGFSSDSAGSIEETLYVSQSDVTASIKGLAKINTTTLKLEPIHDYDLIKGKRAEMTGTGDGKLFGAFEGKPYIVAEIDKTNANILSQAPQDAIQYEPNSSNFAFAAWGGDFWLFVGPGTSTDVFQYKPADSTTDKVKSVDFEIVGAGVSTCAPVKPPA
ncbi:MAG: hypothetical protein HY898_15100 [Deltaproteobacteria bacterium]|nr:hypothetical protein [Deltaproteobacteria bacterium]